MTPSDELPIDIFNDCDFFGDEFMRSFMEDGLAQQPTPKVITDQQRVLNRAAAAKSRTPGTPRVTTAAVCRELPHRISMDSRKQGLTLVHFLAQRKHVLLDTVGTFNR